MAYKMSAHEEAWLLIREIAFERPELSFHKVNDQIAYFRKRCSDMLDRNELEDGLLRDTLFVISKNIFGFYSEHGSNMNAAKQRDAIQDYCLFVINTIKKEKTRNETLFSI
jgi:hypothetical protein